MGEEHASQIYKHLLEHDMQLVTKELAEMGKVPPETVLQVLEEFAQLALTQNYLTQGGLEFAKRLLVKAFGNDEATKLLQKVSRLQELSAGQLASLQRADRQVDPLIRFHTPATSRHLFRAKPDAGVRKSYRGVVRRLGGGAKR